MEARVTGPFVVQPPDAVTIELDPTEAAHGVVRTVSVGPAARLTVVQVPPGLGDGTLVRLSGTDASDPSAVTEVLVRIAIRPVSPPPAVGQEGLAATSPTGPSSPVDPWSAAGPSNATDAAYGPLVAGYSAYGHLPLGHPAVPAVKPRRRWLWAGLISAVVLVLLAASVVVTVILAKGVGGKRAAGTSTPTSTAPPPLSTLDYQQLLTATDTELGTGFAALRKARTPAAVHDAASALSLSAQIAADRLTDVTPPDNAQSFNSQLATDLNDFATMLGETAAAAEQHDVCTASSAIADVTAADATADLRTDIQTLVAASYTFGSFLPEPAKSTNRRGSTGYLKRISNRGLGQLKIKNSGTTDTLVSLVPRSGGKAIGTVYVRGKGNFTMTGVRDGTYRIFVASGVDWDAKLRTFTRTCDFRKFDDTMKFSTSSTQFTIWTITLQATSGGNTQTSDVDPDQFPSG
jgi:hypothetical protein